MACLFARVKRLSAQKRSRRHGQEQGSAMAIVLVASAIAATTTIAVAMRSYNSYVNGTRQSLANRAKEAAEAGLNILIESLNQDHPEWLIEPYNGSGSWSISRAATGGCRENAGGNPSIEGTSNTYSNGTEGKYKLAKYSFQGNNFYGGVGSFEMEGEIRSSNNKLLASAKIYQDMSIIAKACDALPGDTSDQDSLWPGIFVQSRIQNYRGAKSLMKGSEPEEAAEIICTEADCASGKWDSDYPPEPTIGDIELPKTQEPPEQVKGISTSKLKSAVKAKLKKCENFRIPEDLSDDAKWQDSDGTWHVYISGTGSASLNGYSKCKNPNSSIKISDSGPVRLYLDGSLSIGSRTWIDTTAVNHAADFMILGTPKAKTSQKIDIRGEAPNGEALKTFVWLPKGEVKFQLGREKRLVEGAIWADSFWRSANSQLGDFELRLPEDMPQLIYQRLGKEFGIGQRDYVAQGVTSWRSYGRTPD